MSKCFLNLNICKYNQEENNNNEKGRSYYDMTGENNIFKYMTNEVDLIGNKRNLGWVGNQTGVFNRDGVLNNTQILEMKERLKNNKGNIYYGFISVPKEYGNKIDSPQKCIRLLKFTFFDFMREAKFYYKNIDMMCCLHSKVKDHIHMHFVFWEKEKTQYKKVNGYFYMSYRYLPIPQRALERLKLRIDYFISNEKTHIDKTKVDCYVRIGKMMNLFKGPLKDSAYIKEEMFELSKEIPKDCDNLFYTSKNLDKTIKDRIDKIKAHIFMYDRKARRYDLEFFDTMKRIEKGVGDEYYDDDIKTLLYEIEDDYDNMIGNKIFGACKYMKTFEYIKKEGVIYGPNNKYLKAKKARHKSHAKKIFDKFIDNIGRETRYVSCKSRNRLKEIEDNINKNKMYQRRK